MGYIQFKINNNISIQVYPEQLIGKLAKKAFSTLGCTADEFYEGMGFYFVELAGKYG